jgi:hypothetical protein
MIVIPAADFVFRVFGIELEGTNDEGVPTFGTWKISPYGAEFGSRRHPGLPLRPGSSLTEGLAQGGRTADSCSPLNA